MIVFNNDIDQSDLTNECWLIQFYGLEACKTCDLLHTDECGGQNIIKTLTNNKGVEVPI